MRTGRQGQLYIYKLLIIHFRGTRNNKGLQSKQKYRDDRPKFERLPFRNDSEYITNIRVKLSLGNLLTTRIIIGTLFFIRVDQSQRYLFVHLLKNAFDFYIYFGTTFNQIHAVLART